jgi:uncharacterized protein YndB with AHSA1/START domain
MDGTVTRVDDKLRLRFERHVEHPIGIVWAALTAPEPRAKWLFPGQLDLTAGGTVKLTDSKAGQGIRGEVLSIKPPNLLELSWSSQSAPSGSVLRIELAPDATGTLLTLTHTIAADDDAASLMATWHGHLDALPAILAGQKVAWPSDLWEERRARYASLVP